MAGMDSYTVVIRSTLSIILNNPTLNLNGTHEDERTVLYKTKSLDDIKPNNNPKTNPRTDPNPNPNIKLTKILTLFSCFMLFFERRPLIFSLNNLTDNCTSN